MESVLLVVNIIHSKDGAFAPRSRRRACLTSFRTSNTKRCDQFGGAGDKAMPAFSEPRWIPFVKLYAYFVAPGFDAA